MVMLMGLHSVCLPMDWQMVKLMASLQMVMRTDYQMERQTDWRLESLQMATLMECLLTDWPMGCVRPTDWQTEIRLASLMDYPTAMPMGFLLTERLKEMSMDFRWANRMENQMEKRKAILMGYQKV